MSAQAAILAAAVAYAPKIPARPRRRAAASGVEPAGAVRDDGSHGHLGPAAPPLDVRAGHGPAARRRRTPAAGDARRAGARGPGAAAASLAAISLYGVFFGLSLGPIPNIYTESFDGRDEVIQRRFNVIRLHAAVSFYFPVVVARRGPRAAFAAFAAVCGVTWVFVRAAVPQTAQASLEDLATRAA
ncbi:hypothetical protein JL722_10194 [Aureococcus anophagefferens]|nr:hypothetical protein JL722_10194 [Aureococcus anophagefferens]